MSRAIDRLAAAHDQQVERLQDFHREQRQEWHAERETLLDRHDRERAEWSRERRELLNRIKPESAQVADEALIALTGQTLRPLPYDDDDAYQQDRETREQLAARLMDEELNAR